MDALECDMQRGASRNAAERPEFGDIVSRLEFFKSSPLQGACQLASDAHDREKKQYINARPRQWQDLIANPAVTNGISPTRYVGPLFTLLVRFNSFAGRIFGPHN